MESQYLKLLLNDDKILLKIIQFTHFSTVIYTFPYVSVKFLKCLCRFFCGREFTRTELEVMFHYEKGIKNDTLTFVFLRNHSALFSQTFEYYGYEYSILSYCCRNGLFFSSRFLLLYVDPRMMDQQCFLECCQNGNTEIVKLFLKDGRIDPEFRNCRSFVHACKNGHDKIVSLLLRPNGDFKGVDPTVLGNFAVEIACENGFYSVYKLLVDSKGVSVDHNCLISASRSGNLEIVRDVLKRGIDPSEMGNEAVRIAAELGHDELIEEFLKDRRVDPTLNRNELIVWASYYGKIRVVRVLMNDKRVDPSDYDNYAYSFAKGQGFNLLSQVLLKDPRVEMKVRKEEERKRIQQRRAARTIDDWKQEIDMIQYRLDNPSGDLFTKEEESIGSTERPYKAIRKSLEKDKKKYMTKKSRFFDKGDSKTRRRRWTNAGKRPFRKSSLSSPKFNIPSGLSRRRMKSCKVVRISKTTPNSPNDSRRSSRRSSKSSSRFSSRGTPRSTKTPSTPGTPGKTKIVGGGHFTFGKVAESSPNFMITDSQGMLHVAGNQGVRQRRSSHSTERKSMIEARKIAFQRVRSSSLSLI